MLPFRRSFDGEKQQLQQLNGKLAQYLTRTRQLERDNARLLAEIEQLRRARMAEPDAGRKAELRDLRRQVERISLEKSRAEVERERLLRELHTTRDLCGRQTEACRGVSGELHGCEEELRFAQRANGELQRRLLQLQDECARLEDAHRRETDSLRRQVEARPAAVVYRGPPAASPEEVQEFARGVSDGWIETLEMYQRKVEEMEKSMTADRAMLGDLQREKMLYASELERLRSEAEKQSRVQMQLEGRLSQMQENFNQDFGQYQMIIEKLEQDRATMAGAIEEKMQAYEQLLQVKMDLGMEVAAYRALLDGEKVGVQNRRVAPHQRERIIDIKVSGQPYTRRPQPSIRQHTDIRFASQVSAPRRSPVPYTRSRSPSRVIPISYAARAQYESPASRRDMISFTKARAAASAQVPATSEDKEVDRGNRNAGQDVQKTQAKVKQESQRSAVKSAGVDVKPLKVVSPPMMSLRAKTETERETKAPVEKTKETARDREVKEKAGSVIEPAEKKVLDSVSVEEIIEKVIKPAGLEAQACSSGESKVTYHVERSQQEDGSTKTQIVLESKVEEELDVSEDADLDEVLGQGVKRVSLENIKDTATGSMIKNLLSNLQGDASLQNKSVSVEIIEEPVESFGDEELRAEREPRASAREPASAYFQIEELDNISHVGPVQRSDNHAEATVSPDSKFGSVQVREVFRENEPSYFSHDQEPHEYFVSTPDDNLSEPEEGVGITSYGHYGIVDDLSDERYYQDDGLPLNRAVIEETKEYRFASSDHPSAKDSFPECIIEEEVRVSPIVQESVLEFLREDSLEPKEQLRGALEKLQGSVSGPLREELAFLTKVSNESPQNVAVDVKKVQQTSGNGTMTIVAELNVSQTLEESGLLKGEDLSEDQIVAALQSYGLEKAVQDGAEGGYTFKVTQEEAGAGEEFEKFSAEGGSTSKVTEKYIRLGPSETSFTFRMEGDTEAGTHQQAQSHILEKPVKIEKRVATVFLESPSDN